MPLNYLKYLGVVNKKDDSVNRKLIMDKVKSLVRSLADHFDVDLAADSLGKEFMIDSMPPVCSSEEAENSRVCDGGYMRNGRVRNRLFSCFLCLQFVKRNRFT